MQDFVIATSQYKKPKSYNKAPALQKYNFGVVEGTDPNIPNYLLHNTLCINFNNLAEVFDLCSALGVPTGQYTSSQKNEGSGWTKFSTYEESVRVLRNEPQRIVEFRPSDIAINDISESGNDVYYDVVGDYLDVGRYLDGVPEAFGNMFMGNYRGVRVKIFYDASAPAYINSDDINLRSKRLCRLVDWLETQGVRVSVNAIYSSDNGHFDIKIKDYSEPLNIYDVGVVSNSDFFRRLIFRLTEVSKTVSGGYGSARSFSYFLRAYFNSKDSQTNDRQELSLFLTNDYQDGEEVINSNFDRVERYIQALLPTGDYKVLMSDTHISEDTINQLKERR